MNEHPEGETKLGAATAVLMDNEAEQIAQHRQKITRITLALEEMLLKDDCTMGDLAEVMDLMNSRAHAVFSRVKISEVKSQYQRQ